MAAIDDALYEVDSSEFGPRIGAFFTNEGTLVRPSSGTVSPAAAGRQPYKHGTENDGVAEGLRHFLQHTAARIYPESRDLLEAHQRRGHTIVVCTSAPRYEVQPLADDLGVEHVLTQGPIFDSGPLAGPVPRGRGLTSGQLAVKEFAECFDIELDRSWAYASADGDLGLLEQVGHPCALNPTPGLRAAAAIRRWPTRCWPDTDHPGGVPVVRTIAALGSVIPSFLVAAPGGLLGGGRRAIFNRGMSLWGKLSTALAGVRLNVDGDENLWKQRPAVFIMNHQSGLDGLIGARLFEKDYTFVASARFRRNPIIGPVGWLADAAFVEGGNTAEAVKSLEAVTKVIEKGLSIGIAPEGTRSPTRRLGPFKKGAFRIAMTAGVPIVPIVIRNAGDLMPGKSRVIRPGTVDIRVLHPIPVDDWTLDNLNEKVDGVRQLYLTTLANWPRAVRRDRP